MPPLPTERYMKMPGVRSFPVGGEVVLVRSDDSGVGSDPSGNNRALALNESGRAIWELCSGRHTVDETVDLLVARFHIDRKVLEPQVESAVDSLAEAGFIEPVQSRLASGNGTVFVVGIEDKPYCWWQTAIFLESFQGKLPAGWSTLVAVCNDYAPLSHDLRNILSNYPTAVALGRNHAKPGRIDTGMGEGTGYSALNRVEALSVAASHVGDENTICLLDSDIFLYGDLNRDIMPTGCAAPRNWHVEEDLFFATVPVNEGKGIDLRKLLEALGCKNELKPGAVNIFVSGNVAKNEKFMADCFRFAEALYLLGRVSDIKLVWISEMVCFALAMTANGIPYELLQRKELLVSDCDEESIPSGTFYHYYSDPGDIGRTAFFGSKWYKHAYMDKNFLRTEFGDFARNARTDHERYFFSLAKRAADRLYV